MNLLDAITAAKLARAQKPPRPKWFRAPHVPDEGRTAEWNAWRERQALHAEPRTGPARKPATIRQQTAAERRARRLSTRSSRRRAARKASR